MKSDYLLIKKKLKIMRFILFQEEISVFYKIQATLNNLNKVFMKLKGGFIELDNKIIYAFLI